MKDEIMGILTLVSLSVAMLSPSASGDAGWLFPCPKYDVGEQPYSLVFEDLDGDEDADLAVLDQGEDNVIILLNQGDGVFTDGVICEVGSSLSYHIAAGDLDGDGDPDLVLPNYYTDTVSILINQGDGTFAPNVQYETGSKYPRSTTVGDLDGDGDGDLAVVGLYPGTVSVLLNHGDASFAEPVTYELGGYPTYATSVAIDDLDGDGFADLAVATRSNSDDPGYVAVLLNLGDGTFGDYVLFGVDRLPNSVAIEDIDGDGDADIAATNLYGDNVSILLNNGDGTFADHATYGTGPYPRSVAVADHDGDGDVDLVVSNCKTGPISAARSISILLNNGDGTFAPQVVYGAGISPMSVAIADLEGDGDADLAVVDNSAGSVTIVEGYGDGTFAGYNVYNTGRQSRWSEAGDLDGDGDDDLAVACFGSSEVSILLNRGDGTFADSVDYSAGRAASVVLDDLDGDGDLDVAVTDAWDSAVSILLNHGDGTFAERVVYDAGPNAYAFNLAVADLDGDGDADLATPTYSNDVDRGNVSILLNHGDGTFADHVTYAVGVSPRIIAIDDLDGDGDDDIAVTNSYYSYDNVSILLNHGDGTFAADVEYDVEGRVSGLVVADFDSDEDADLAMVGGSHSHPAVKILLNHGDGSFFEASSWESKTDSSWLVTGDFDGDGDADLALPGSGGLSILLNHGDATFTEEMTYAGDASSGRAVASDLDGDGDVDLAVPGYQEQSERISIYLNQTHTGPPPPNPADITGPDGTPDGTVDVQDLLLLLGQWGTAGPEGDITGLDGVPDGIVDVHDLLALLGAWGPC